MTPEVSTALASLINALADLVRAFGDDLREHTKREAEKN